MKKSTLLSVCILLLVAGYAFAQGTPSAKFAATYTDQPGLASVADLSDYQDGDKVIIDSNTGYTLATIKVPQDKELLVGVSAEIGIVTDTSIRGKNGGSAKAIADGEAYVNVYAVPRSGGSVEEAAPGQIMLSKRVQELDATLGGVIQSCSVSCIIDVDDLDGDGDTTDIYCYDIDIATDCIVTDEEIALLQDTTAAHHFNFVFQDLKQGVYDVKAVFTTGARAEVDICTSEGECDLYDAEGVAEGSAYAKAIINKTMVTVQEVRAAKGGIIDLDGNFSSQ